MAGLKRASSFQACIQNIGGRAQILDQMFNYKASILHARSEIDNSEPFQLDSYRQLKDYAKDSKSFSFSRSPQNFKQQSPKRIQDNNLGYDITNKQTQQPPSSSVLQSIMKGERSCQIRRGRGNLAEDIEHQLHLASQKKHIKESHCLTERKKNILDADIYPSLIIRQPRKHALIDYYNPKEIMLSVSSQTQNNNNNLSPNSSKQRRNSIGKLSETSKIEKKQRKKSKKMKTNKNKGDNTIIPSERKLQLDDIQKNFNNGNQLLSNRIQGKESMSTTAMSKTIGYETDQPIVTKDNNSLRKKKKKKRHSQVTSSSQIQDPQMLNNPITLYTSIDRQNLSQQGGQEMLTNSQNQEKAQISARNQTLERTKVSYDYSASNSKLDVHSSLDPLNRRASNRLLQPLNKANSIYGPLQETASQTDNFQTILQYPVEKQTKKKDIQVQTNDPSIMSRIIPPNSMDKQQQLRASLTPSNKTVGQLESQQSRHSPQSFISSSGKMNLPKRIIKGNSRERYGDQAENKNKVENKHTKKLKRLIADQSVTSIENQLLKTQPQQQKNQMKEYQIGIDKIPDQQVMDQGYSFDIPILTTKNYDELRIRLMNIILKYSISQKTKIEELFAQTQKLNSQLDPQSLQRVFQAILQDINIQQ